MLLEAGAPEYVSRVLFVCTLIKTNVLAKLYIAWTPPFYPASQPVENGYKQKP